MEIWKDIKGYEGYYQVSNMGRVKSLKRLDNNNHIIKEKILSDKRLTKDGYNRYSLNKDGKSKEYRGHRLVLCTFLNCPLDYEMEVNHKDGNKNNNQLDNLEFCTHEYNMQHAVETGLRKYNKPSYCRKLSKEEVKEIRRDYIKNSKKGNSSVSLANKYGVSHRVILDIVNYKSYKLEGDAIA